MKSKEILSDYLHFSRKDRIAAAVLAALLLALIFLPQLFEKKPDPFLLRDAPELRAALDTLAARPEKKEYEEYPEKDYPKNRERSFENGALFHFDPNTLAAGGWQRLGLNERSIKTIMNYRAKGGRFRKADDLQKIWGLPRGFYERVAHHIRIESKPEPAFADRDTYEKKTYQKRTPTIVPVNEADSNTFLSLPGIGPKLCARIIHFRERLGGFYSVDQVAETFGLPDSTFQKIKPLLQVDDNRIRKLSLNTATEEQLKSHPYVRWKLASLIVAYRKQHGNFNSIEDMKKIEIVDETLFEKLRRYLEL